MLWIRLICLVGALVLCSCAGYAKEDEPGWSITAAAVAGACGAPAAEVEAAAGYIAEWATRHLSNTAQLTKEKALALIQDDKDIKAIVDEKHAFIYPCDRWIYMLRLFNKSKGAVMGDQKAPDAHDDKAPAPAGWSNYDGECSFSYSPTDPPISPSGSQSPRNSRTR